MESTDSSTGSQQPQLPPGFRFHPTDEELVVHYLKKKAASAPLPVTIIAEVDLYKFDPWELPGQNSEIRNQNQSTQILSSFLLILNLITTYLSLSLSLSSKGYIRRAGVVLLQPQGQEVSERGAA